MELFFEMLSTRQPVPARLCRKVFGRDGGMIGRAQDCDWVIPDNRNVVSNRHAYISHCEGMYFLTDISNNGTWEGKSGRRLRKGEAIRIEHGSAFALGDFELHARLASGPVMVDLDVGRPQPAGSVIPDDAHLELDPLRGLDQQAHEHCEVDDLILPAMATAYGPQRADYACIDSENLLVPQLVAQVAEPSVEQTPASVGHQTDGFWEQLAVALGVDLQELDQPAKEAVALNAARLLKQCIGDLQQSLWTLNELKYQLRLAPGSEQVERTNPLQAANNAAQALGALLLSKKPDQVPAEKVLTRAFHDLQAHQVALLAGSRAVIRGALEHFSPQQLTLRFERDHKPLFASYAHRWKAYGRYHQALREDEQWVERLLVGDFAPAYHEQIRLISTLHYDQQG